MFLGLGWAQWLTIICLVAGLILTFKMMAKASVAYDKARRAREAARDGVSSPGNGTRKEEP